MNEPSDQEQLVIELINRARANPQAEFDALIADATAGLAVQDNITEALNFFGVDLGLLAQQLAGVPAVQPLAWSAALGASADAHTALMVEFDQQSHFLPGETGVLQRILEQGYENPSIVAENVFAFADDALFGHAGFFIDWGEGPGGIQSPAAHRNTVLDGRFSEIGVGIIETRDPDLEVGPLVMTQHFGDSFTRPTILTGVLISDGNEDGFYGLGEGLGGVAVTAVDADGEVFSTVSFASGGYNLPLAAGSYTVTYSGGELDGTVSQTVKIADQNVKLDVEYLDAVPEGALLGTRGDDAGAEARLTGTDGNDDIRALEGDDVIVASAGSDIIRGGPGSDTIIYAGTRDQFTMAFGESGETTVTTGNGETDVLEDIEKIDFSFGDLVFDIDSDNLGFGYRLYSAAFARTPDSDGVRFWIDALDQGLTRKQVAEAFVASAEFAERYGVNPTDAEYVTALYDNVLGRGPDPVGFNYWLSVFADGTLDRADMLIEFAESDENIAANAENLDTGVFVISAAELNPVEPTPVDDVNPVPFPDFSPIDDFA